MSSTYALLFFSPRGIPRAVSGAFCARRLCCVISPSPQPVCLSVRPTSPHHQSSFPLWGPPPLLPVTSRLLSVLFLRSPVFHISIGSLLGNCPCCSPPPPPPSLFPCLYRLYPSFRAMLCRGPTPQSIPTTPKGPAGSLLSIPGAFIGTT